MVLVAHGCFVPRFSNVFCYHFPLEKRHWSLFDQTWIPFTQRFVLPSLDGIGRMVLKKMICSFLRRWQFLKFTNRRTDGRTNDGRQSIKKGTLSYQFRWVKGSRRIIIDDVLDQNNCIVCLHHYNIPLQISVLWNRFRKYLLSVQYAPPSSLDGFGDLFRPH